MLLNKGGIQMNNKYHHCSITAPIEVTNHAIQRFRLRQQKQVMSNSEVIRKIVNQVRHSKLIQIDGNKEYRNHSGFIYVIQRLIQKNGLGLLEEKVIVVTMLMSKLRIREHFSDDFSSESIDLIRINKVV